MRKFTIKFILFFLTIYLVIGYYYIFVDGKTTGDIGNAGYISFGENYATDLRTDNKYYVHNISDTDSLSEYSILTIGDSFSNLNIGYSDFMGKNLKRKIANVPAIGGGPEQTFICLVNSGQIPQNTTVIIESVERSVIGRLVNLDFSDSVKVIIETNGKQDNSSNRRTSILERTTRWLRLSIGYKNPVLSFRLSRDFFTHERYEDKLFIYNSVWDNDGDLLFVTRLNDSFMQEAQINLIRLKDFADSNNVQLIYVVAMNKYDAYSEYIVDNEYPEDPTMQLLQPLDSSWCVNTKTILRPYINQGVKDVYYVNDTHWSPVGAKIVGDYLATLYNTMLE